MNDTRNIAIIGFGLIGQSWSISFARAGYQVLAYDQDPSIFSSACSDIEAALADLEKFDLLWGQKVQDVLSRITQVPSLRAAINTAQYVQENTPEDPEIKTDMFRLLDAGTPPDCIIASSTSALLPSQFTHDLPGARRCLVAHPLNPPHLIPAVELVPNPATDDEIIDQARALMVKIGQTPILANREIPGFIMNRLQGALLDEAFALVAEDLADVEDVDRAVRDGLSRRWSFMGPFETIDLNAPGGVGVFMDRYGPAYSEIGKDRPNRQSWDQDMKRAIVKARRTLLPEDELQARREWRDRHLAKIAAHYNNQKSE